MNPNQTRTWAEVNLNSLAHNYIAIKSILPGSSKVMGIVKADAYGHGVLPVAKKLVSLGCPLLGVACLPEAEELRRGGIGAPIIVLGPTPAVLAPEAVKLKAALTISDLRSAREMSGLMSGSSIKIHLKLETGMGRTGFNAVSGDPVDDIIETMRLPNLEVEGIYTHFAVSEMSDDPFTLEQFELFIRTAEKIEEKIGKQFTIKHCANSGAVVNYSRKMSKDMIRPGITLYGMHPGSGGEKLDLLPVMTLKTRVAAIALHKAGETISYGRTYTLGRDSRIAVLPIGYGDGLHRVLSNKLMLSFEGKYAPQIGAICMDMCMADVTDLPEVEEGSIAVVFGEGGASANEVAKHAGTISYEIFCALTNRVPRIYTE